MQLFLFILIAHGLTQILCYGKILDRYRPQQGFFGELLKCSMCTGFWVGLFLGGIDPFTGLFSLTTNFLDILFLGFVSSGTSYMLDKTVSDEGIQIQKRW